MLEWHWTPGAGGLMAIVPARLVEEWLPQSIPAGCTPVRPLHLTCLRSGSMAPLVGVLDSVPVLPQLPVPVLHREVHIAQRSAHPLKDPAGSEMRRTGFLAVANQAECHAVMRDVVSILDAASRSAGGPHFPHPEPERFFHLSVWNNRGGDAMRSIGDIRASDIT